MCAFPISGEKLIHCMCDFCLWCVIFIYLHSFRETCNHYSILIQICYFSLSFSFYSNFFKDIPQLLPKWISSLDSYQWWKTCKRIVLMSATINAQIFKESQLQSLSAGGHVREGKLFLRSLHSMRFAQGVFETYCFQVLPRKYAHSSKKLTFNFCLFYVYICVCLCKCIC